VAPYCRSATTPLARARFLSSTITRQAAVPRITSDTSVAAPTPPAPIIPTLMGFLHCRVTN